MSSTRDGPSNTLAGAGTYRAAAFVILVIRYTFRVLLWVGGFRDLAVGCVVHVTLTWLLESHDFEFPIDVELHAPEEHLQTHVNNQRRAQRPSTWVKEVKTLENTIE